MKNDDGSYTSIYTHWDGYPSNHGPVLLGHYSTPEKVRELMALGDLSVLDENIGTKHGFESRPSGECTAYGRDRGEKGVEAKTSATLGQLKHLTQDCGGEYLYLFDDGVWYVAEGGIAFFGNPASKLPRALQRLDRHPGVNHAVR